MIQTLFPSQKNLIVQWQNTAALGVVAYTLYLYSIDSITPCHGILTTYFAVDLLFAPPEAALHHTLSLIVMSGNTNYGHSQEEANDILKPFVKTEISTLFLLLKLLYEQKASDTIKQHYVAKTLCGINDLLFVTTFIKTRLWDLTFDAMLNPEIHQNNRKYFQDSIIRILHFYTGFFGLYALNLYWTAIIFRKLFKDLIVKTRLAWINTSAIAEQVLPWTLFLCVAPYVLQSNMQSNMQSNLRDATGATGLAIASYIYHRRKRNILNSGKETLFANNIFLKGLNDSSYHYFLFVGAIHLKSFLSVVDGTLTSVILHVTCFMGSHFYSLSRLNDDNKQIGVLTASIAIPIVYDLVYIISATDDRVVQTQIGFVAVALAVIIKVFVNNIEYDPDLISNPKTIYKQMSKYSFIRNPVKCIVPIFFRPH